MVASQIDIMLWRHETGRHGPLTRADRREIERWVADRDMAALTTALGFPPLKTDMEHITEQCAAIDRRKMERVVKPLIKASGGYMPDIVIRDPQNQQAADERQKGTE